MLTCAGFALGLAMLTCRQDQAAQPAAAYCDVARPIFWAASDTRRTKEQADRENRKYRALCGTR